MTAIAASPWQGAVADEVRRTSLPAALVGTWAASTELCQAKDDSNYVITNAAYGATGTSCSVNWVVQTAGATGPNYSVHATCMAAAQEGAQQAGAPQAGAKPAGTKPAGTKPAGTKYAENLIFRPDGIDTIMVGKSFADLKRYQRCAASQ